MIKVKMGEAEQVNANANVNVYTWDYHPTPPSSRQGGVGKNKRKQQDVHYFVTYVQQTKLLSRLRIQNDLSEGMRRAKCCKLRF